MNIAIDVRDALPMVSAPTLVLQQRGDPWTRAEQGRYLAQHGTVELDGADHIPTAAMAPQLLAQVMPFWKDAVTREAPEPDKERRRCCFPTSPVLDGTGGRTRRRAVAGAAGRPSWAGRAQLARFRGVELDTAGDGFFARFDGPARGIRCALAIRVAVRELGIEVRLGLHAGECEVLDAKVAGIAVAIGARVSARAAAGEVRASQTVKDLVAGSGITFDDRGLAELKGVPGEWRLFSVVSP